MPVILPPLFAALAKLDLQHEVIISDDCSTDASIQLLQNDFPQVKIMLNASNQGFSPTINKGIFAAQYDYVFLLNSDVILLENYFIPLLRYFDKEDTFGVMGRIVGWDDEVIQDAAKYPSFHGVKIKTTGNYLPETISENDWLHSMYLSGANAFVDRKKLLLLGGFDEIFAPFYVEDFEISLRAWRLGWKCYYEHFAICRHRPSTSIKSKSSKKFVKTIYYRNKLFLHFIHLPAAKLLLWYLQLIPETLFSLITGKLYFFTALRLFFSNRDLAKKSKDKFNLLLKNHEINVAVQTVAASILLSLKNKKIKKF